jgi:hypothetical protein
MSSTQANKAVTTAVLKRVLILVCEGLRPSVEEQLRCGRNDSNCLLAASGSSKVRLVKEL